MTSKTTNETIRYCWITLVHTKHNGTTCAEYLIETTSTCTIIIHTRLVLVKSLLELHI